MTTNRSIEIKPGTKQAQTQLFASRYDRESSLVGMKGEGKGGEIVRTTKLFEDSILQPSIANLPIGSITPTPKIGWLKVK